MESGGFVQKHRRYAFGWKSYFVSSDLGYSDRMVDERSPVSSGLVCKSLFRYGVFGPYELFPPFLERGEQFFYCVHSDVRFSLVPNILKMTEISYCVN